METPGKPSDKILCEGCGTFIEVLDEALLLELHETTDKHMVTSPCVDTHGQYTLPPVFLHLECWEELENAMAKRAEDTPKRPAKHLAYFCNICEGEIDKDSPFSVISYGSIVVSKRTPNGKAEHEFKPGQSSRIACADCLMSVVDEYLPGWDELHQLIEEAEEYDDESNEN